MLAIDVKVMPLVAWPGLGINGLRIPGLSAGQGQNTAQQMLGALTHQARDVRTIDRMVAVGRWQISQHQIECHDEVTQGIDHGAIQIHDHCIDVKAPAHQHHAQRLI